MSSRSHRPSDLPRLINPSRPSIVSTKMIPAPGCPPPLHLLDHDHVAPSNPRDHYPLASHSASPHRRPAPSLPSVESQSQAPSSSPPQVRPTPLFPPPRSAPHHHFPSSASSHPPNMDRYSITNLADRYLRGTDKYLHNQLPLLDHRRMSESATYGNAASGHPTNTANLSNARHHQHEFSFMPPRSYAVHPSPSHRLSHSQPIGRSSWKENHQLPLHSYDPVELEEPLSPLNPSFSGGECSSPLRMSGVFGSLHEDYGPSPPGTGTSTSSNPPDLHQRLHTSGSPSSAPNTKQYSFVSLPGNEVKKRPRRRYDEIERLYQCSWPNCTKAYGTLNHLNAHITMQNHGPKRTPNEFKELRKQWRKAKKEEAEANALEAARRGSHQNQHSSQHHTSPHSVPGSGHQSHNVYADYPARSLGHLDDLHDSHAHPRRSQRYDPFVSPHLQHSGIAHPHSHGAHTSTIPIDRLPVNSTLLTPLPGYEPSSMSGTPCFDSYDLYRSDSRLRTGQASSESHGDRGRPRSHNRDRAYLAAHC